MQKIITKSAAVCKELWRTFITQRVSKKTTDDAPGGEYKTKHTVEKYPCKAFFQF